MPGYNLPDGCGMWPSDLDFHDWLNGRWDEREPGEDPNEEEEENEPTTAA